LRTSLYFSDLFKHYLDEIDDLLSDSEGKTVFTRRLKDKRREFDAILPMIEYSPEMVAVVFHDAFGFASNDVMQKLVQQEPEFKGFLAWSALQSHLTVADWAKPLVESALAADGGDRFLVATAGLEFLRVRGAPGAWAPEAEHGEDDGDDEDTDDLGEAGSEWLSEQGFENLEQ